MSLPDVYVLDALRTPTAIGRAPSTTGCRPEPEFDPELVDPDGGAIAIGHPLGASIARILGALARQSRHRGGGHGPAAICIGVNQGLAVVLEGIAR
ncbi:hypothetical protein ACN28C_18700 [Plantactinospora sp. WMMC1484]|uniref:hypothetical protein n=1 Tax=Plantactinospora sp. WMMC1484 TaxID=3404122 RepID=UPI003BF481AB